MKKKTAPKESKSLKTFFLYSTIVFLLIFVSLSIKTISLIQQSKFDGGHQFLVAVVKQGGVEEIVGFNPQLNSISVLIIENSPLQLSALGKTLGIVTDAKIEVPADIVLDGDITRTLTSSIIQYNSTKTNLTIIDLLRLTLLSKNVAEKDKTIENIKFPFQENRTDKIIVSLFGDKNISSENSTLQIINGTEIPGMGRRLERVLVNLGANVISVSTSHTNVARSKIQYFGSETYTVEKIKKILLYSAEKLNKETIADIVIIIGKDAIDEAKF